MARTFRRYSRSRRSRKRPRVARRTRRTVRRRSTYRKRTFNKFQRGRKPSISVSKIASLFPDVAISKLKFHSWLIGVNTVDADTDVVFNPAATTNGLVVALNANPHSTTAPRIYHGTATTIGQFNPVQTYMSKYQTYRCHGVKITVTITAADTTEELNTINAAPLVLFGFPFQRNQNTNANYWPLGETGYNYATIPQMKYGFRRVLPGMGGKSQLVYKTYWTMPKLFGNDKTQWLSNSNYESSVNSDNNPSNTGYLGLWICDLNPNAVRQYNVDFVITQYGRWEGQQPDRF